MQIGDSGGERLQRDEVRAVLRRFFPAESETRGRRFSLELVDTAFEAGGLKVTLRLVVWDAPDGKELSIRDIKEQEVWLGEIPPRRAGRRFVAFVDGWTRAVRKVFDAGADVETLMPHDLCAGKTRTLPSLTTPEDFERAHLVKSRLGRWMR